MKTLEPIYFENRDAYRRWLKVNHDKSPGILMVYYKKHTGTTCITYREALEESLCFGWIDSTIRKLDEEKYTRQFTPRTNISNWSDINKGLVLELIQKRKMTEAGLKKIDIFLKTGKIDWKVEKVKKTVQAELIIPEYILDAFAANDKVWEYFNKLAPSHKRNYVSWITSAKREETILKRIKESMELLSKNGKLGYK